MIYRWRRNRAQHFQHDEASKQTSQCQPHTHCKGRDEESAMEVIMSVIYMCDYDKVVVPIGREEFNAPSIAVLDPGPYSNVTLTLLVFGIGASVGLL